MRFAWSIALCVSLVIGANVAVADVDVPVKFEGSKDSNKDGHHFNDLGNFHGAIPAVAGAGWHYWGAREPIVTDDFVVFPVKGDYLFTIKSKSDQFDPGDRDKDIWGEFEVRLYTKDARKNKLAEVVGDLAAHKGNPEEEVILLLEKARADTKTNDDWATSETLITIEGGTEGQLAVWFLNDQWQPDPAPAKDRNLHILSIEITSDALAVEASGKLATTWGDLRR
ncbi:MAG: hypothetical protein O3A46_15605 [Candidatus Poribacteria bacterium]|nr:hypothetical protein [Candidatus Poribacteria bacterium]